MSPKLTLTEYKNPISYIINGLKISKVHTTNKRTFTVLILKSNFLFNIIKINSFTKKIN